LYALGETSCTGLHGANRLASNSLLEALVYAQRVVEDAQQRDLLALPIPDAAPWSHAGTTDIYDTVVIDHDWDTTRRVMWDFVGIVRSDERLAIAAERIAVLQHDIDGYYRRYRLSADLIELRNIALVGDLIIRSAQFRRESRGLHHTTTWPALDPAFEGDTVLSRFEAPTLLSIREPVTTEPPGARP
jgi:L-aspartate oxidase